MKNKKQKKEGKVFINALHQGIKTRLFFGGMIAILALINLSLYIYIRIKLETAGATLVQEVTFKLYLLVTAICSIVMIVFLLLVYFQLKNTVVLIGPKGISYLSLLRKIRSRWEDINEVFIIRTRHGKKLSVGTANGTFSLGVQFVNRSEEIPDIRFHKKTPAVINDKGEIETLTLEESEIFKTFLQFYKGKIVERFIASDD